MRGSVVDRGLAWLLAFPDPSVRYQAHRDLLGQPDDAPAVRRERAAIPQSRRVRALLRGQRSDGGFGSHPYRKWTGAHWRLAALADLAAPADEPVRALADHVLRWIAGPRRWPAPRIAGRVRRCASIEGNVLLACTRLGLLDDPRVRHLAEALVAWQWPDGGWNCDRRPEAAHSSFHESWIPLWGLAEYGRATGADWVRRAVARGTEFLLRHRLFRSHRTGGVVNPAFLRLRYPAYWHYDVLHGLRVLARVGAVGDPRAEEALRLVEGKRGPDGAWRVEGRWWQPARGGRRPADVVDWGGRGRNAFVTLNALRVLGAAGRFSASAA